MGIDRISFTFPRPQGGEILPDLWPGWEFKGGHYQHEKGLIYQFSVLHQPNLLRVEGNPSKFESWNLFCSALGFLWGGLWGKATITRLDFCLDVDGRMEDWAFRGWIPSKKFHCYYSGVRLETVYFGVSDRILRVYDKGLEGGGESGKKVRFEIQRRYREADSKPGLNLDHIKKCGYDEWSKVFYKNGGECEIPPWISRSVNRNEFRAIYKKNGFFVNLWKEEKCGGS